MVSKKLMGMASVVDVALSVDGCVTSVRKAVEDWRFGFRTEREPNRLFENIFSHGFSRIKHGLPLLPHWGRRQG
jgi:hypothetical protein